MGSRSASAPSPRNRRDACLPVSRQDGGSPYGGQLVAPAARLDDRIEGSNPV